MSQYMSFLLRCTCGEPRATALNLQPRSRRARVRNYQNSKCSRGWKRKREKGREREKERDRERVIQQPSSRSFRSRDNFWLRPTRTLENRVVALYSPLITIRVDVCHVPGRLRASSFVGPKRHALCTWRMNGPRTFSYDANECDREIGEHRDSPWCTFYFQFHFLRSLSLSFSFVKLMQLEKYQYVKCVFLKLSFLHPEKVFPFFSRYIRGLSRYAATIRRSRKKIGRSKGPRIPNRYRIHFSEEYRASFVSRFYARPMWWCPPPPLSPGPVEKSNPATTFRGRDISQLRAGRPGQAEWRYKARSRYVWISSKEPPAGSVYASRFRIGGGREGEGGVPERAGKLGRRHAPRRPASGTCRLTFFPRIPPAYMAQLAPFHHRDIPPFPLLTQKTLGSRRPYDILRILMPSLRRKRTGT